MQELSNMFVILISVSRKYVRKYLVKLHEFPSVHFLCLGQGNESDSFMFWSFISERSLDFGHIMCSNCNESPIPSEIGMQFILKCNERLVSPFREFNSSKNCGGSIRSDSHRL